MADYPATYYNPRAKENWPDVVFDSNKKAIIFVEDFNSLEGEILAIEKELGLTPKEAWETVKKRLQDLGIGAIIFIIDGGGSAITTGEKGHLEIPFKCEIQRATLLADQVGSIVIDIWKDTYANFPPTDADSITSATPPTISAAQKSQDATLTGWTKTIDEGDILAFNVDSAATITRVVIVLKVKKIA